MSVEIFVVLFVASIFVCWAAQEWITRSNRKVPRTFSIIFHVVYVLGLAASFFLL
ncbi:MAG: hypothetical protein ACXADL_05910 [Candidatus Thorarchaeota archaeon]